MGLKLFFYSIRVFFNFYIKYIYTKFNAAFPNIQFKFYEYLQNKKKKKALIQMSFWKLWLFLKV